MKCHIPTHTTLIHPYIYTHTHLDLRAERSVAREPPASFELFVQPPRLHQRPRHRCELDASAGHGGGDSDGNAGLAVTDGGRHDLTTSGCERGRGVQKDRDRRVKLGVTRAQGIDLLADLREAR